MEAFIDHQVQLVQEEKRIDVEDTQKLLSSYSPIQLQKRGMALLGLRVTGKDIADQLLPYSSQLFHFFFYLY
jgi:hypothetical protein